MCCSPVFPISKEKPLFCIRVTGAKQGSNRWKSNPEPGRLQINLSWRDTVRLPDADSFRRGSRFAVTRSLLIVDTDKRLA